jgi:Protein of unknown function (DUF3800)
MTYPKFSESDRLDSTISIRALVCGYPREIREKRVLAMLRIAYGDDSGKQSPLMVVGALVATVPAWEKFSDEWAQELRIAKIKCFKMVEAATWPVEKLRPFQAIIKNNVEYATATPIRRDEYRRMFGDGRFTDTLDKEIWAAHLNTILWTLRLETKRPGIQKIEFVFDVVDKANERELVIQWERLRTDAAGPHSIHLPARARMGNPPLFRNDESLLPLQAADMVAWYYRRKLLEEADETNTKKIPTLFGDGFPVELRSPRIQLWSQGLADQMKAKYPNRPYEDTRARGRRHKAFVQDEAKKTR